MNKVIPIALTAMLAACGSTQQAAVPTQTNQMVADCVFPDAPEQAAPSWICEETHPDYSTVAVGSAAKSKAGVSFTKTMAIQDGRSKLGQILFSVVSSKVKTFAESQGVLDSETIDKVAADVSTNLSKVNLIGSKPLKTRVSPKGELYVLMVIDDASVQKLTTKAIETSMGNEPALWQQFQAEKAHKELAKEIANL